MTGLKLVPNESVGYRLKPDYYNWTVVALKRHGATSKNAGEVYETPVGYFKNPEVALNHIFQLETRMHGEAGQKAVEAATGEHCSHDALLKAIEAGLAAVKQTAELLQKDLKDAGLDLHELAKHIKGTDHTEGPVSK